MKKSIFTFAVLLIFAFNNFAQQKGPSMSFDKEVHDYGTIEEESGKAVYNFRFVNTGSEPLVLTNVKTSCGCTTPKWTKKPILPTGEGFIEVAYNPKNRPGKFNKTITVTSNVGTKVLKITGNVNPKTQTIEDIYPQEMGGLRLKTNHFSFVKMKNTEQKTEKINVMNVSDKDLKISFERIPRYITIKAVPETLKANQKGYIEATYNGKLQNKFGFGSARIGLLLNDKKVEIKSKRYATIAVSATIEEDFSKLTPEALAEAPRIEFESKIFDFKSITQGDKVDYIFKFKNTGKSDLVIRRTKASCGCTLVNLASKVIKAGESGEMKATFNSRGKKNRQNKRITVITNDPNNSTIYLKIIGMVNVPKK